MSNNFINISSYIYFFFILLYSQITKNKSMYIQSFDKGYITISSKLREKFEPLYHIHEELIHSPEIININTDTISADQDHPIKLKLPYKTGDLGTDIMELLYIKKSGILFSIKNYNVTYFLNEENVIHSIYPNMFPNDIEDTIENDVDCNYTILNNKYKLEKHIFKKFYKIIFFSYISLVLDKEMNNIKYIDYNNINLNENNIEKNINIGKEYFNNSFGENNIIFLGVDKIEQLFFDKNYFVFLVKNKKEGRFLLLFYNIILLHNEEFSLNLELALNLNEILNNNELKLDLTFDQFNNLISIIKIGYYKNYIFLLISNNKNEKKNELFIFDYINNKIISHEEIFLENNIDIKKLKLVDFLIYNKTFCLLSEDKGLFIYDIKEIYHSNNILLKIEINFNTNFEFYNGKKLEIYRNPFYDAIFLCILFNKENSNNNIGDEIYMEILLGKIKNNNEIEIRINKIITASNSRKFTHMYLSNDFFRYFFDDINKELFIYRNGLLNIIPYATYKLNLTEDKIYSEYLKNETITNIIPLYNKKDEKFNVVLIGNNKSYFIIKNLTLASHSLNCTFHDIGSYDLTFILKGEVCANSLKKAEEGTFISCHKIIKYNFHVYRRDTDKRVILFFAILFVLIFLASVLFICYSISSKCFGKYKNSKTYKIKKILFSQD